MFLLYHKYNINNNIIKGLVIIPLTPYKLYVLMVLSCEAFKFESNTSNAWHLIYLEWVHYVRTAIYIDGKNKRFVASLSLLQCARLWLRGIDMVTSKQFEGNIMFTFLYNFILDNPIDILYYSIYRVSLFTHNRSTK
jgi:hypothetical protein